MKKIAITVAGVLLALLALSAPGLLPGVAAQAATAENTGDIGFYVKAKLPENQLDKDLTYFDLRVSPDESQTLEVEVVNETNEEITVDIDAISASTNRNGIIDYKTPNVRDETLANPFSELAAVEDEALSVPANGSAVARVTVTLPNDEYEGVVLGGLVFTRRPDAQVQSAEGMSLKNLYSYVIGVKLSENDTPVSPDFELAGIQGETVNYQAALVHSIRNKNAAIAKGINLHVVLKNEAGEVVGKAEHTGIDMAPNSVMPLAVTPVDASGNSTELKAGTNTSHVTLNYGGESWTFEQTFTVGSAEAWNINSQTFGSAAQSGGQPNTLLIIILIAAAAIIAGLFVVILLMLRRREETKELNRLLKQRMQQIQVKREIANREF